MWIGPLINSVPTPWPTLNRTGYGIIRRFEINDHVMTLEILWQDTEQNFSETFVIDCWTIHWRPDRTQAVNNN